MGKGKKFKEMNQKELLAVVKVFNEKINFYKLKTGIQMTASGLCKEYTEEELEDMYYKKIKNMRVVEFNRFVNMMKVDELSDIQRLAFQRATQRWILDSEGGQDE